jgi:HD-like signal output (HDOD) protein
MQPVNVRDLEPGQTLANDISNLHGQVIAPAGTVVSPRVRSILKAWGIVEVSVEKDVATSSFPAESPVDVAATESPRQPGAAAFPSHPGLLEILNLAARLKTDALAVPTERSAMPVADTASRSSPSASLHPSWPPLSAETVAQSVGVLPSLPTIHFQVERAINHPSNSAGDIAAVLGTDQALSARLLRLANSAFYGFPKRIDEIAEAVRIIGTRQLHDLVLATVVVGQFRGLDTSLVSMRSFWRHSLAAGLAARAIAGLRRESNIERYFVAGLLHDIGSLVLYQQVPERAQAALKHHHDTGTPLEDAELGIIGCTHAAVGAALLAAWKLPPFFRAVAANHHCPDHHMHTTETGLVHIADVLTMAMGLGSNGEQQLPRFSPTAWDLVGLDVAALERAAHQVLTQIEDAESAFLTEGARP